MRFEVKFPARLGHVYFRTLPWRLDTDGIPMQEAEYSVYLGNRMFLGTLTRSYFRHPKEAK